MLGVKPSSKSWFTFVKKFTKLFFTSCIFVFNTKTISPFVLGSYKVTSKKSHDSGHAYNFMNTVVKFKLNAVNKTALIIPPSTSNR